MFIFYFISIFRNFNTSCISLYSVKNNKGNVGIDPVNLRPDQRQIILTKKDSKTGKPLQSAFYTFYCPSGSVAYRMRTSGASRIGYLSGYLNPGTYTVKETAAPAGYKLDTTVHKLTIPKSNSRLSVTYYDNPIVTTGSLKIKKIDSNSGLPLSGADFSVTDSL